MRHNSKCRRVNEDDNSADSNAITEDFPGIIEEIKSGLLKMSVPQKNLVFFFIDRLRIFPSQKCPFLGTRKKNLSSMCSRAVTMIA